MLTAFLQCTLEDRQGLTRLNIIAQAWTSIKHWFTSIYECLLILSLPGKALRMPVDIARLSERFNRRSQIRLFNLSV